MDDTTKDRNTSEWVRERMATLTLAPAWQPNPDFGLVHVHWYARTSRRRRLQAAAALGILIASLVVLAVPTTRVVARQLWDRFYMRRPEAVRSMMPRSERPLFRMEYTSPPSSMRFVADVADAQQEAGFEPRLPPMLTEDIETGLAVLKVNGPIDARIRIHVDELTAALQTRGIDDVRVPQSWDGVEIGYHLGPQIVVAFLGGSLAQARPPALTTPPGFLVIDFTEIALRAAGLNPSEAHNARNMFADSGGAFAIVPSDAKSDFREVSLKAGPGLLFENGTDQDERLMCSFCPAPYERVLTWVAADRIFQLRSQTMTVDQVVALANSIN